MAGQSAKVQGGIGVCGALGIAFVVLELCAVLDWSWWWVLAPFWAPAAAVLVALVVILLRARWGQWRRPPGPAYEPVHGWTKPQLDGYLARNPRYRPAYEAELAKHR